MTLTYEELERHAYVANDPGYQLYAELADAELADEGRLTAWSYIDEAKGSLPGEDCLQSLIDQCRTMAQSRVTKADLLAFCEQMETMQSEIAQSSEYGLEQLEKAQEELK